jgi:Peptidase propeptide and YPEB domain
VFLLALLATKTCAADDDEVSFEEAEAIAREQVDFEPEHVIVKAVKRGLDSHLYWAVSLSTTNAVGIRVNCATVEVDAETGATVKQLC